MANLRNPGSVVANLSANGSKLGNPDGETGSVVDGLEMAEEVIAVVAVPVNGSEVVRALATAGANELLEPRDALAVSTAIGDGGSADASLAGKGVHVLNVGSSGDRGRDVGLASVVGLVEAEKSSSSVGNGLLGVVGPARREVIAGSPEHGNELNAKVRGEVLDLVPSVSPANLGVTAKEAREKLLVVIGETTLLAAAGDGCGGSGGGSGLRSGLNDGDDRGSGRHRSRCLGSGGWYGDISGRSSVLNLAGLDRGDQSGLGNRCHGRGLSDRCNGSGSRDGRGGELIAVSCNGLDRHSSDRCGRGGSGTIIDGDSDPVGDGFKVGLNLEILLVEVLVTVAVHVDSNGILGQTGHGQEEDVLGKHICYSLLGVVIIGIVCI